MCVCGFCAQSGETALHIAALCHKSKVARLLVKAGCSCKLKNKVILNQCSHAFVYQSINQSINQNTFL